MIGTSWWVDRGTAERLRAAIDAVPADCDLLDPLDQVMLRVLPSRGRSWRSLGRYDFAAFAAERIAAEEELDPRLRMVRVPADVFNLRFRPWFLRALVTSDATVTVPLDAPDLTADPKTELVPVSPAAVDVLVGQLQRAVPLRWPTPQA